MLCLTEVEGYTDPSRSVDVLLYFYGCLLARFQLNQNFIGASALVEVEPYDLVRVQNGIGRQIQVYAFPCISRIGDLSIDVVGIGGIRFQLKGGSEKSFKYVEMRTEIDQSASILRPRELSDENKGEKERYSFAHGLIVKCTISSTGNDTTIINGL